MDIWKKMKLMAEIKVPIQVNLPDDWVEQIIERFRNDPEAEWVNIVRCKDCKYYVKDHGWNCIEYTVCSISPLHHPLREPNDFCSRAERRNDELGDS